jgi:hypothetical protein
VELDAVHGIGPMPYPHDFSVFAEGVRDQIIRDAVPVDGQGVITTRRGRGSDGPVERGISELDQGGLAVHDAAGPDDPGPEGLGDRLMAQTDPEDGNKSV